MALAPRDFEVVSGANVFAVLRRETVACMTAAASIVRLAKREILYRQNDHAGAFFVIVEGKVKLSRITSSGEMAVIDVLGRGECIAAAAAFAGAPYPATAEAVGKVRAVRIPATDVVGCLCAIPDFALAVMTSSSRHSDRLIEQIEQLKTQDGVQRLARFLASLCPVRVGACLITLPYDKASLAGYLGLAPETLSRDFAKLKSIGIEVRGSRVAVSEAGKLHRLAAEDRSAPDEIAKPVARTISCPKLTCCCAIGGGKR